MNDVPNIPLNPITQEKAARVQSKRVELQKFMSQDAQDLFLAASGYRNGNDFAQTEIQQDFHTMVPHEFEGKYGTGSLGLMYDYAKHAKNNSDFDRMERTTRETVKDTTLDVGGALVGMGGDLLTASATIGGIAADKAAQAIGIEDADSGARGSAALAQLTSDARGWFQDQKSDLQQQRAQRHALESELNQEESMEKYEQDLEDGKGNWSSWLRRVGRDTADGLSNYADDPSMVGSVAAEGAAYLIPMAAATRVVGLGLAASKVATEKGISKAAAKALIKKNPKEYAKLINDMSLQAVPFITAVTEGGSGASQGHLEILQMSDEELIEIPQYREYLEQGLSPDSARVRMAQTAGGTAGAVSGGIGFGTGFITRGFEANPLSTGTKGKGIGSGLVGGTKNISGEVVEEGLQEGGNQLGVNVGLNTAGVETDLAEGLGESIAGGIVGGGTVAGATQAPGVAIKTSADVLKLKGKGLAYVLQGLGDRAERRAEKDSIAGPQAQQQAAVGINTALGDLSTTEGTQDTPQDATEALEVSEGETSSSNRNEAITQITESGFLSQGEMEDLYGKEHVDSLSEEDKAAKSSRANAIILLSEQINHINKELKKAKTDEEKTNGQVALVSAASALIEHRDKLAGVRDSKILDYTDTLEDGNNDKSVISALTESFNTITENPSFKAAEQALAEMEPGTVSKVITPELIGSLPKEQKATAKQILISLAKYNPEAVDIDTYDAVLDQNGALDLSESDQKLFRRVSEMLRDAEDSKSVLHQILEETAEGNEILPENVADVREQIYEKNNTKRNLSSIREHEMGFNQAMSQGNRDEAVTALEHLKGFAQSMSNKVAAINQSARNADGQGVSYQSYDGNGRFFDQDAKHAYVIPGSKGSARFARVAREDAFRVIASYNRALKAAQEQGLIPKDEANGFIKLEHLDDNILNTGEPTKTEEKVEEKTEEKVEEFSETNEDQATEEQPTEQDAEPEIQETAEEIVVSNNADVSVETRQKLDLKSLLTNLIKPKKGSNLFAKNAKRRADGSNFLTYSDPLALVQQWIEKLKEMPGNRLSETDRELDDQTEALVMQKWVSDMIPSMIGRLQKTMVSQNKLNKPTSRTVNGKKVTKLLSEWIEDPDHADEYLGRFNKTTNFLEKQSDGSYRLDPRVAQAAVMAFVQVILNQHIRGPSDLTPDEVRKKHGLQDFQSVPDALMDTQGGSYSHLFIEELARDISEILGVSMNEDTEGTFAQGLFLSLAADTVDALTYQGDNKDTNAKIILHTTEAKDIPFFNQYGQEVKTDTISSNYIVINKDNKEFMKELDSLKKQSNFFSRLFAGKRKVFLVGSPIDRVSNNQHKNASIPLTKEQKEVLEFKNQIPNTINHTFMTPLLVLGDEVMLKLFGHKGELDKEHMDPLTYTRLNGINMDLERQLQIAKNYFDEALDYADAHDMDVSEVEIFFDHGSMSTGRQMQIGPATGQASKILRELVMPTKAEINLVDPVMQDRMWIMAAQALGIKLQEETTNADIVKKVKEVFKQEEMIALQSIFSEISEGNLSDESIADLQDRMLVAYEAAQEAHIEFEGPVTFHAIAAITEMQETLAAADEGATSIPFTSRLYIEADGISDGPINAAVNNTTGEFTEGQKDAFEQGGLILGAPKTNMNQSIQRRGGKDAKDVYGSIAERLTKKLLGKFVQWPDTLNDKGLTGQDRVIGLALMRVMNAFGSRNFTDFSFNEDAIVSDDIIEDDIIGETALSEPIEIGRGAAKDPSTQITYGSGAGGVANGLAKEIIETLMETLTEAFADVREGKIEKISEHELFINNPSIISDLEMLFNNTKFRGEWFKAHDRDQSKVTLTGLVSDLKNAEIHPEAIQRLRSNIREFYTEDVVEAVDETLGGVRETMFINQFVASFQGILFRNEYNRLYDTRHKELGLEDWQELSRKDEKAVVEQAMRVAPIYSNGDQRWLTIDLGRRRPTHGSKIASVTGSDKLATTFNREEPGETGVKVSPLTVQGTGDAQMIINLFKKAKNGKDAKAALSKVLDVFDGVNMPLDVAEELSKWVNEAVWEGWFDTNIISMVHDSLRDSLAWMDPVHLSEEARKELVESIQLSNKRLQEYRLPVDENMDPFDYINVVFNRLKETSLSVAARKLALNDINSTTDHLHALGISHTNEGKIPETNRTIERVLVDDINNPVYADDQNTLQLEEVADPSSTEVLEYLNERYEYHLVKLQKASDTTATRRSKPTVQKVSGAMQKLVDKAGRLQEEIGVRFLNQTDAVKLFSEMRRDKLFAHGSSATVYDALIANSDVLKGFEIFIGKQRDLTKWRNVMYPDLTEIKGRRLGKGQVLVGRKLMFITNPSPETLLHEALHAVTFTKLVDYYSGADTGRVLKGTVKRLERLLEEFMEFDTSDYGKDVNEAYTLAKAEILKQQAVGNKAAMISEFISWGLSNEHIAKNMQKTKVTNKLAKVSKKVMALLRHFLFGEAKPKTRILDNMFEHVLFNAEVLNKLPESQQNTDLKTLTDTFLHQSDPEANAQAEARLQMLEEKYLTQLRAHMQTPVFDPIKIQENQRKERDLLVQAQEAASFVESRGFSLNPRTGSVFQAMHVALHSGMKLHASSQREISRLYQHAVEHLEEKHFYPEGVTNPSNTEKAIAQQKLKLITGDYTGTKDRKDHLVVFTALSQIDPDVSRALSNLPSPKSFDRKTGSGFDGLVQAAIDALFNWIILKASDKAGKNSNIQQRMNDLSVAIMQVEQHRQDHVSARIFDKLNTANDWTSDKVETLSVAASGWLSKKGSKAKNPALKNAFNSAALVSTLVNPTEATGAAEGVMKSLDKYSGFHTLRSFVLDLVGETDSSRPYYEIINRTKSHLEHVRQMFRTEVPNELKKNFKAKPTKEVLTRLYEGMLETDLLALGVERAKEIMADRTRINTLLTEEEKTMRSLAGSNGDRYMAKVRALAIYMVRKDITSKHLLRNAESIANLTNEGIETHSTEELIRSISRLISLQAMKELDPAILETMEDLSQNEPDALSDIASYLYSARRMEIWKTEDRTKSDLAYLNGWKGYGALVTRETDSVIIAPDRDEANLKLRGYVRLGDAPGTTEERSTERRGYYRSTSAGKPMFRQGIAQTIHQTYMGVDERNGITQGAYTSGVIMAKPAQQIRARMPEQKDDLPPGDYLLPFFDEHGKILGYERPVKKEYIDLIKADKDITRMLGVWTGRIVEEREANKFNQIFVDVTKKMYDDASEEDRKSFTNIADSDDPIIKDAWNTLGPDIKEYAEKLFEKEGFFPMRRNMVEVGVGFRRASVTDFWTGNTRFKKENQDAIRKSIQGIMGYKTLKTIEDAGQSVVSFAKNNIIVRSGVVMFGNHISNHLHLSTYNIGPSEQLRGQSSALVEVTEYTNNISEITRLNVRMGIDPTNTSLHRRLSARIAALEEANAQLSINPLIEEGEFNTVSGEDLTEADRAIQKGRLGDLLENLADKAPDSLVEAARQITIAKDTAIFQAMNKGVQYSDFLAKTVLYKHLLEKKGMSHEDAMKIIRNEFVNYNLPSGRMRDMLEANGMLWFANYKLRSMRVMLSAARNRPLSFLLTAGLVGPATDVDSVWDGSIAGTLLDGRGGYMWGPEMALDNLIANPLLSP